MHSVSCESVCGVIQDKDPCVQDKEDACTSSCKIQRPARKIAIKQPKNTTINAILTTHDHLKTVSC